MFTQQSSIMIQAPRRCLLASCVLLAMISTRGQGEVDPELMAVVSLYETADRPYDEAALRQFARTVDTIRSKPSRIRACLIFGAALCETPGYQDTGQRAFDKIPRMERHLTPGFLLLVDEFRERCPRTSPESLGLKRVMASVVSAVAGTSGKGDPILKPIPGFGGLAEEELVRRRYDRAQRASCVEHIERMLDSEYLVRSSEHYVLALDESFGSAEALAGDVLNQLEGVLRRLCRQFDLEAPPQLIVVYLVSDGDGMVELARKIHGLSVSKSSYGYSYAADSSIVVKRSGGRGTFGHEVFHALLDHGFCDAPPWLNEGMASLFEEYATAQDGSIRGTYRSSHWRMDYLPRNTDGEVVLEQLIPIDQVIRMDWQTFDASGDRERAQRNQLVAKMFAMYLQEEGLLAEVLKRLRGGSVLDLDVSPAEADIRVIEGVSDRRWADVQGHFMGWLKERLPAR